MMVGSGHVEVGDRSQCDWICGLSTTQPLTTGVLIVTSQESTYGWKP